VRCQLEYAQERSDVCEELLSQITFRVEGINVALMEILKSMNNGPGELTIVVPVRLE
jgi:hypothetical protein